MENPTFALKYKGQDTAKSACQYYKAIQAVEDCGQDGALVNPRFTFGDWKARNGLAVDPTRPSAEEATAFYFNAGDLNLGRAMHGRRIQDGVAYYVCNYGTIEQASVHDDEELIACVAMDYSALPPVDGIPVNNNQPFTKFYVFDQRGNLSPEADLDFQGPLGKKFVPGLCVNCHGGDNYSGQFPEDLPTPMARANAANIGGHFLPFDLENLQYADDLSFMGRSLSKDGQQEQFRDLNQFILDTNVTPVVRQLLSGWYDDFRQATQNSRFVPRPEWQGQENLYLEVVKPSCRTCHSVMRLDRDFNTLGEFQATASLTNLLVCGGITTATMPNAEVTLNRFWRSRHDPNSLKRQPQLLEMFLRAVIPGGQSIVCPEPRP